MGIRPPIVMKTTTSIVVLAITLAAVSVASADEKSKQEKATKTEATKSATVQKTKTTTNYQYPLNERVALTGSYIKRDVRRSGQITDGPSQVLVLDSKTIENSGAADLRQLLVLKGVH